MTGIASISIVSISPLANAVVVSVQLFILIWLVPVIQGLVVANIVVQLIFTSIVSVQFQAVQYRTSTDVIVLLVFDTWVGHTLIQVAHIFQAIANI